MALADASVLPLSFGQDLLATLDVGIDDDSKCRKVPTYHCAWWLARKPRNLDSADIMDRFSIDKCLEVYRHLLLPSQRGEVITSGSMSTAPSAVPVPPAPAAPLLGTSKAGCDQCERYRDLLSSVLRELVEVRQFASAMATAAENQWGLDMRRASTFNLLYEAAVIKECGPATRPPRGNKGERAKAVEEKAREELQRLQALPPSSHKWTWGEWLTKADVLGLARSGTRPGKIHSGYDISLKGGKNSGEDSFAPSLPTSHGRFDDLPEDVRAPLPDASLAGPSYFTNFRHRLYDPLSLNVSEGDSASPSAYRRRGLLAGIVEDEVQAPAPAPAPAMLVSVTSPLSTPTPPSAQALPALALPLEPAPHLSSMPILADNWSSGSDEEDVAGIAHEAQAPALALPLETAPALSSVPILADDWSSGSDEEGGGGLAEEWSSASGDESEAIPAVDDVVENWSSASQGSSGSSNSQMVASQSRITLDTQSHPPLVLDMVPLYSEDFRVVARSYGPQDFGHLAEEMFEDSDTE